MATELHPITGVALNPIVVERKAHNFKEAITGHLMRWSGEKYQTISQRLGTNTFRVGEVLTGEAHPKAKIAALRLRNE